MNLRKELRLNMTISRDADDALTLLAQQRRMTRREVIESLLLGEGSPIEQFARREGLSADELRYVRGMA